MKCGAWHRSGGSMTRPGRHLVALALCLAGCGRVANIGVDAAATTPQPDASACSCGTRLCGTDACGTSCGTCRTGETCDPSDGLCRCTGAPCDQGSCPANTVCGPTRHCVQLEDPCLTKVCPSTTPVCMMSGCGSVCLCAGNSCGAGQSCVAGTCSEFACHTPYCAGRECGADGCAPPGNCGICADSKKCNGGTGMCVPNVCAPECGGDEWCDTSRSPDCSADNCCAKSVDGG